ncbi:MAG: hypothetical protein II444_00045 [Firmicutes bacterium]|nr:hypothetical protein [Bacillota bacterium]
MDLESMGIVALIPPFLAIILAIITKQVIVSLFIAVFVGAMFVVGGNPWTAFYSTFFDFILPQFEDTDHQRILALTTFCGGLSLMLEFSGGAEAFAQKVNNGLGKTRRGSQLITGAAGVFVWFSDSTNPVLVGPICRSFTDKAKVSREKLAYIVDSTTAAVPCLFPISAWGAYIIGLMSTFYTDNPQYNGNAQASFMAAIPFQYYTIGSIIMVFIIAATGWDYGPMKHAEDRAIQTGKLFREGASIKEYNRPPLPEGSKPTIWNMLLPVIVLIVFIFVGLAYTGDAATNGFIGSLREGSSLRSLDTAMILAAICAGIMGIASKVFTLKSAVKYFIDGCTNMMEVLMILMLAWGIGGVCKAMGTANFIVGATQGFLTPLTMCAIIFVAGCLTSFSTGSSWTVFAIFIPIAAAMASAIGAPIGMAIGCVLSGGIFGDHCSPVSDTTVMSSFGSSCDHLDHVATQLPYALTVAVSALIGYLVTGATGGAMGGFLGLIITIVLICVFSFALNKKAGRGADASTSA